jgi:hypothetical protein
MQNLFGDEIELAAVVLQTHIPFTLIEADLVLDDAPAMLLQELGDCIKAFRAEKLRKPQAGDLTKTKIRFFDNVCWIYDLTETAAVLSFDVACCHCEVDSDVIRSRLSSEFGPEIRDFLVAYTAVQPVDAIRVRKLLRRYVDIFH